MQYRPEIDGLRAVAIIPVIIFHSGFSLLSGGFVGVDIFFVISGYLITSIILAELEADNFSIINFYERRGRRILPALFLVLMACIPFAWFWLMPQDMKSFSKSVLAVSIFSSNVMFWRESGYFDAASELKPLLHTWSLAVEEQYYVLFPLFLMGIWRFGRRTIVALLISIAVLSLFTAQWMSSADPAAGFYLLPTRGWELLIGAIVACLLFKNCCYLSPALAEAGGWIGVTCIVYAIITYSQQTPHPSFHTLLPVIGAACIIYCASNQTIVGKILAFKPLVSIGLVSYSAYLWHQPLFAFAHLRSLAEPTWHLLVALIATTFILAYFTWRYVESPFRKKQRISRRALFTFFSVFSVFYIGIGFVGYQTDGDFYRQGFKESTKSMENRLSINRGLSEDCDGFNYSLVNCRNDDNPEVLVWGDSFAMHLVEGLKASNPSIKLMQTTASMCGPILGLAPIALPTYGQNWASECLQFNEKVMETIKQSKTIKYVVLGSPFNQYVGSDTRVLTRDGRTAKGQDLVFSHFTDTLAQIRSLGVIPTVFSPPPQSGYNLGQCLLKSEFYRENESVCDFDITLAEERQRDVFKLLRNIDVLYNVVWLSDFICQEKRCKASDSGVFIYRDAGHLSREGSHLTGFKMNFYRLLN